MVNILKLVFGILILLSRFYIIFKITFSLYDNFHTQSNLFNDLQWYICALLLDLYLMNLENHLSSDIYIKKNNGQKTDSGDN